jgi:hypothetical protein
MTAWGLNVFPHFVICSPNLKLVIFWGKNTYTLKTIAPLALGYQILKSGT